MKVSQGACCACYQPTLNADQEKASFINNMYISPSVSARMEGSDLFLIFLKIIYSLHVCLFSA